MSRVEGVVVRDVTHVNPDHIVQILRSKNNKYYIICRRNLINARTMRLQISKEESDKIQKLSDENAYVYMMKKITYKMGEGE